MFECVLSVVGGNIGMMKVKVFVDFFGEDFGVLN